MKDETKKALLGSIQKWEGIVAGTVKNEGASNCPLCHRFEDEDEDTGMSCVHIDKNGDTERCPVAIKTGCTDCGRSPYYEYMDRPSQVTAQAEVDFLRSLLPAD